MVKGKRREKIGKLGCYLLLVASLLDLVNDEDFGLMSGEAEGRARL